MSIMSLPLLSHNIRLYRRFWVWQSPSGKQGWRHEFYFHQSLAVFFFINLSITLAFLSHSSISSLTSGREGFVSQTRLIHWQRNHAYRCQVKSRREWVSSWNEVTQENSTIELCSFESSWRKKKGNTYWNKERGSQANNSCVKIDLSRREYLVKGK